MKKYIGTSLKLTLVFIVLCSLLYPLLVMLIAKFAPGGGKGETLMVKGKVVGYANVGQKFTADKYFLGRPSAADYNAANSSGSNKGAKDSAYLKQVSDRIDSFLVHNPAVKKEQIPAELVTASASGLDPDLSPEGASIQIKRIAAVRKIDESKIANLVEQQTVKPLLGLFGPPKVNVLKLNIALDQLQ